MKKFYVSLFAICLLFISTSMMGQTPWWVENVLFIDVIAGPNGANGQAQCIVHFQPGAETVYNAQYDAQVFPPGPNSPFIYSLKNMSDLTPLGVNGFPSLTQDYSIPLGFRPGFTGTHKFVFEDSATFNFPETVYLEDRANNSFTNIILNPTYTFNAAVGDSANTRFVLHAYGRINVTVNNASNCGSAGSLQVGPGGSQQWVTYALRIMPANTVVSSGNYTLPLNVGNLAPSQYKLSLTNAYGYTYDTLFNVNPGSGSALNASLASHINLTCAGTNNGSASVSATGGNGNYFVSWNTVPPQSGTTATNLAPGQYIATVSDNGGCSDTVHVTITAPPALLASVSSIQAPNCDGDLGAAAMNATGGTGNITYSWNTNPVQTGTAATDLTPGNYVGTATDGNGCTDTVHVNIPTPPTVNVSLAADNDTVVVDNALGFDVTFTGTDSLTWDFGDGTIIVSAQDGMNHTFDQTGTYTVTVTTQDCGQTSTVTIVVVEPVGLNETNAPKAIVTLVGGKLTVVYNTQNKLDIAVYNTMGQLTDQFNGIEGNNGIYSVNLKNAAQGIYYINIADGTRRFTHKMGVVN